jgi:hypothetical protein
MCVGLNIHFYIDMNMFIGEFHDQGWPQGIYYTTTNIFICDIKVEGDSLVMCSWTLSTGPATHLTKKSKVKKHASHLLCGAPNAHKKRD